MTQVVESLPPSALLQTGPSLTCCHLGGEAVDGRTYSVSHSLYFKQTNKILPFSDPKGFFLSLPTFNLLSSDSIEPCSNLCHLSFCAHSHVCCSHFISSSHLQLSICTISAASVPVYPSNLRPSDSHHHDSLDILDCSEYPHAAYLGDASHYLS